MSSHMSKYGDEWPSEIVSYSGRKVCVASEGRI